MNTLAQRFLSTIKPNVASLGYALFLAINAAGVWGGVFPFLPIEFQKHDVMFGFFLAQALVFTASYLASAVGAYLAPGPTRTFLVPLAGAPYFLGWCCLIAGIYLPEAAVALAVCGGALLGLGSAGFYMLWQRLFASQDPAVGTHDLILGTAYASVLYFALYLIPQAITAFLIPLVFLPLFGLCIVLKSRQIDRGQPMFEDVPREHPLVYRQVVRDYWRSAVCMGALGFCAGIMRSLAIGEPEFGTLVNMLSMGAAFVGAVMLFALWQFRDLHLNVVSIYRVAFPFIITSFLLLPLLPPDYHRWQAAGLYAVYSAAIMLMMVQCAQAARDRGINPVFIYGFFAGIVYILHDLGFIAGTFTEQIQVLGVSPMAVTALVALYLLGLMYFVSNGGFRRALGARGAVADSVELVALHPAHTETEKTPGEKTVPADGPTDAAREAAHQASRERAEAAEREEHAYRDRLSKQAELVRAQYRLSARETEVMELIARGYSVARIAEELVVSENTIRTHSKRIYAKLDIHKKQELVDLVENF